MQPFSNRRRLYLLRHGEVNYFDQGRPVPPDSVHLNEEGRKQAAAAALALADISFNRAVTSGLPRTDQTAAIVLGQRPVKPETMPALREIRSGRLSDIPRAELRSTFVDALTRRLTIADTFLLGETFGDFQDRVLPAFHELIGDRSWNTLLLVAHGAVNRVILADVLGAGLENLGHMEQDAGCINLIDFDQHGYGIIRLLNYTPYNTLKDGLGLTTMERYFLKFPPVDDEPAATEDRE
jgi:probable phosphoglycerate mutase